MTLGWSDLSSSNRTRLLTRYESGENLLDVAATLGMGLSSLKRRLREHRETLEPTEPRPRTLYAREGEPTLTDLTLIDPETDQGLFVKTLYALRDQERRIAVMHPSDIHFPYHHEGALSLLYQLVRHVQPHLIAVGSDAHDLASISAFEQDPDEGDGEDILDSFERYWNPYIHHLDAAAPDSTFFYILGNHEKRIYDFIMRQAPQIRATVWRRFVEIIRCGGRVLWLGETDTARIGPLLVTHGNRTGVNPAKGLYDDVGGQLSVMAGHVHRLSYFGKRGEDYMVEAITGGCLTNYAPYHKRKRHAKWQLGTAIADVDLGSREVHFDNLKFDLGRDRISVRFERKLFEAENPRDGWLIPVEEYLALDRE